MCAHTHINNNKRERVYQFDWGIERVAGMVAGRGQREKREEESNIILFPLNTYFKKSVVAN